MGCYRSRRGFNDFVRADQGEFPLPCYPSLAQVNRPFLFSYVFLLGCGGRTYCYLYPLYAIPSPFFSTCSGIDDNILDSRTSPYPSYSFRRAGILVHVCPQRPSVGRVQHPIQWCAIQLSQYDYLLDSTNTLWLTCYNRTTELVQHPYAQYKFTISGSSVRLGPDILAKRTFLIYCC